MPRASCSLVLAGSAASHGAASIVQPASLCWVLLAAGAGWLVLTRPSMPPVRLTRAVRPREPPHNSGQEVRREQPERTLAMDKVRSKYGNLGTAMGES